MESWLPSTRRVCICLETTASCSWCCIGGTQESHKKAHGYYSRFCLSSFDEPSLETPPTPNCRYYFWNPSRGQILEQGNAWIVGLTFPFLKNSPWELKGQPAVLEMEGCLQRMWKRNEESGRSLLQKLRVNQRALWSICHWSWHHPCRYKAVMDSFFHIHHEGLSHYRDTGLQYRISSV